MNLQFLIFLNLWSLQLRLRRGFTAEGGGEEAVPAFPVPHPLPALLPGTEAAQAHETRERECSLHADGRTDGRTDAVIDPLPSSLQVIGLLDVFTPAAALEDFSEL